MRLTQSKELNKNNLRSQVRNLSNTKKYNNIFFIDFFLYSLVYFFSLISGFVLHITINIFLVIPLPSTVFLLRLL